MIRLGADVAVESRDYDRNVLVGKIDSLRQENRDLLRRIDGLEKKLDYANEIIATEMIGG